MKILLIEDDRLISDVIKRGVEEDGHSFVDTAADGVTGYEMALGGEYAVILLDIMLAGMDGWHICHELRANGIDTPILMLTARDTVEDRVYGLKLGADDYLIKPFDFSELLARIEALSRRAQPRPLRELRVADLVIHIGTREVRRGDRVIELTPREYALLEALAREGGQPVARDTIRYRVWNDELCASTAIEACIEHLRKKIDGRHCLKLIHAVGNTGYMLTEREDLPAEVPARAADCRWTREEEEILLLARLETGQHPPRRADYDLEDLYAEALIEAQQDDAAQAPIQAAIADDARRLRADPHHVRRLLSIVLEDALRRTPPDGWITFTAGRQGRQSVLTVTNTGAAPDPEVHRTKLAICRRIAALHGGNIDIDPAPGGGARVTVRLPDNSVP